MTRIDVPERILVIAVGDIGDLLLATPALQALRTAYPAARIDAMTKPSTASIVVNIGLIDRVRPIDKHLFDRPRALLQPARAWALLRYVSSLRSQRYDKVVVLHHLTTRWGALKFALLSLVTGAKSRVGLDNGRGWFLTGKVKDSGFGAVHESMYWLQVVANLTGDLAPDTEPVGPLFCVTDDARMRAAALLRDEGINEPEKKVLAIHAGSGAYSTARRWAPERFAQVADTLVQQRGLRVVLVGGDDERDVGRSVAGHMHEKVVDLTGRTTLEELAAVLEQCQLLIANDTGVGHLASAVRTPVVSVFGPSNVGAWHPLGRSVVVQATPRLPCMPCIYRGNALGYPEGCPPRYCLQEVMPAGVVAATQQVLDEQGATNAETERPMTKIDGSNG